MIISKEGVDLRTLITQDLTDVLIRMALVALMAYISLKIFSPFLGVMLWALVLAVTLYPLHQKLAAKLGGSQGKAATILVLAGMLVIDIPVVMMGSSVSGFAQQTQASFKNDTFSIRKPPESVAHIPIVGPRVHSAWKQAAEDLPNFIKKHKSSSQEFTKTALGFASGFISSIFQFFIAMVIAGIMMAWGKEASDNLLQISCRIAGNKEGAALHKLSTATIRSISLGVIGVAFIQALLFGVGLYLVDLPTAGLLTLIVLLLGIAQIPAVIVSIPVIIFIWFTGDSAIMNVVFTVYFVLAGMADNVLKPFLLGRGVDAPMPVVLLGALGGAVSAGLIGLFIGSVFLSLAYVIFMNWVHDGSIENDLSANNQSPEQLANLE